MSLKNFLQKLDFKFPLSVSCVHFICSSIGAYIVIKVLKLKPLIVVDPEDRWRRIFPMSFVFCINIVLGNVSLRYIPVSFMQTIKSFTPATTGWVFLRLENLQLLIFLSSQERIWLFHMYIYVFEQLCYSGWYGGNTSTGVFGRLWCLLLVEFFWPLLQNLALTCLDSVLHCLVVWLLPQRPF